MKEELSQLLGKTVVHVDKLFGDASYRAYFRIVCKTGETFILMAMPEGRMSVSEEITNIKEPPTELPFINIRNYLASLSLPVPEIKVFSKEKAWLILEDLGDVKLVDYLRNASEKETLFRYKEAIDLLLELQAKAKSSSECYAFRRSFDAILMNWEFDHFWEYYFQSESALQPTAQDKTLFAKETRNITEELSKLPFGFTHRDYQSRNLMRYNNRFYIIDFQDALLGPKVYDLVCLLRDSYVDITKHLEELLRYYAEKSGASLKTLRYLFDLQTVQRKLKDSGRFVFIDKVKKNPSFLQYIPVSMGYVKAALERLPEYENLYIMLRKYVKEWR